MNRGRRGHKTVMDDEDTVPPLEDVVNESEATKKADDGRELESRPIAAPPAPVGRYNTVFPCNFCTDSFDRQTSLILHESEVHKSPLPPHYCSRCERRYRTWGSLLQHKVDSMRHSFCPECKADCPSPRALQAHLRAHHGPSVLSRLLQSYYGPSIAMFVVLMSVLAAYCLTRRCW